MKDARRWSLAFVVEKGRLVVNALLCWTLLQFLVTQAVANGGFPCKDRNLNFTSIISYGVSHARILPLLEAHKFDIVEVVKDLTHKIPEATEKAMFSKHPFAAEKIREINLDPLFQVYKELSTTRMPLGDDRGRRALGPLTESSNFDNFETLPVNWCLRSLLMPLNSPDFGRRPPKNLTTVTSSGNAFFVSALFNIPSSLFPRMVEKAESLSQKRVEPARPQAVPPCSPQDSTLWCIGKALEIADVNLIVVTDPLIVDRWQPAMESIPNIYLRGEAWAPDSEVAKGGRDAVTDFCCGKVMPTSEHEMLDLPLNCEDLVAANSRKRGAITRPSAMPRMMSTRVSVNKKIALSMRTPGLRKRAVRNVKDAPHRNLSEAPDDMVNGILPPELGNGPVARFTHENAAAGYPGHHRHIQGNGSDHKRHHAGSSHHTHYSESFPEAHTVKTVTSQAVKPSVLDNGGSPTVGAIKPLALPSAGDISTGPDQNHVQSRNQDDFRGLGSIVTVAVSKDDASPADRSEAIATTANNAGGLSTTVSTVPTVAVTVTHSLLNATVSPNAPLRAVGNGVAAISTPQALTSSSTVFQGKPRTTDPDVKETVENVQTESKVLARDVTKVENSSPAPVSAKEVQSKKDVETTKLKPAGIVEGKPESSSPFLFVGCIFVGLALCTIVGMLLYHYCSKASAKKLHSNAERTAGEMEIPRGPEERGAIATADYRPYA